MKGPVLAQRGYLISRPAKVERLPPPHDRCFPVCLDVADRQVQQLCRGLVVGEMPPRLQALVQPAVQALNGVGSVHQSVRGQQDHDSR